MIKKGKEEQWPPVGGLQSSIMELPNQPPRIMTGMGKHYTLALEAVWKDQRWPAPWALPSGLQILAHTPGSCDVISVLVGEEMRNVRKECFSCLLPH
jgi:hypothetical protein